MSGRTGLEQALTQQLAELVNETTRQTGLLAELKGLSLNDVLQSGTVLLDANGQAELHSSVPYASVGVWSYGAEVTVTSATAAADAPAYGLGVIPVPAGAAIVWPLTGTSLTIHGTAGELVLVALWSKPQWPMVANGGGGGFDGGSP